MDFSLPLWFLPVLGSALTLGFYDLSRKHSLQDNSAIAVLFFATLCGSVFYLLVTLFTTGSWAAAACTRTVFLLIFLKSFIVSASWICEFYAMREQPISIAAPIRASAPLWTFIGSVILYSEIPTVWQGAGMLLIFGGYYFFSVLGKSEGISFMRAKGIHLMLLGTMLGAGSALYDKYLLNVVRIPPNTVQFWFSVGLVVILGTVCAVHALWFRERYTFRWRWTIPVTGILLIVSDFLYFYALATPDIRISIVSLVRRSNCIVSFAVGAWLFHDVNVKRKSWALALILLGVTVLALAK